MEEEIIYFYNVKDGKYYQSRYTHRWLNNLQQQCKKQKEVIDKAIEYVKENCAQSYCLPPKIYDVRCLDLNALLEILEDKEVSK